MKSMPPRLWETMTVDEMRRVLRKTKTAILPLGVTEQHGYHLPLCTDTLDAWELAKRISARTGAVVAPALPYSFSGGDLPGTINVSPQVMSLMVQDIVSSIVQNGFKNIVIVLGHGGSENFSALKDALHIYLRQNPHLTDVVIAFAPAWLFSKTWMKQFRNRDYHAGRAETSLIMAFRPDLVKPRITQDPPHLARLQRDNPDNYQLVETLMDSPHVIPRVRQRPDIKVGVMGYPEEASTRLGKKLVEELVAGISALIRQIERKKRKRYHEIKIKRKKLVIM